MTQCPDHRADDEKLRVALVGLGAVAQVAHLPALAECETIKLRAVCDVLPEIGEPIAAQYGVSYRQEFREVLEDPTIEAVILATPRGTHAALTLEALEAGKHVLCEKPAALKLDDAVRMKEASEKAGLALMIGYMWHYDPAVRAARAVLEELGQPAFACQHMMLGSNFWASPEGGNLAAGIRRSGTYVPKAKILSRSDAVQRLSETGWPEFPSDREWKLYEVALEYWQHFFDLARMFLGKPESVEYSSFSLEGPSLSFCEVLSGVRNLCVLGTGQGVYWDCGMHVAAEKGWLRISLAPYTSRASGTLDLCLAGKEQSQSIPISGDWPFLAELKHFASCIRTGMRPETTMDDAILDVRLAEVLVECFRSGRRITSS